MIGIMSFALRRAIASVDLNLSPLEISCHPLRRQAKPPLRATAIDTAKLWFVLQAFPEMITCSAYTYFAAKPAGLNMVPTEAISFNGGARIAAVVLRGSPMRSNRHKPALGVKHCYRWSAR